MKPAYLLLALCLLLAFAYACQPPDVCTMPTGMSCVSDSLSQETNKLNITLVHGLEKTIIVTGITCTKDPNQFEPCDAERCPGFVEGKLTVEKGKVAKFFVNCNDENGNPLRFNYRDAFIGKINVEYYFLGEDPSIKRTLSGNIYECAAKEGCLDTCSIGAFLTFNIVLLLISFVISIIIFKVPEHFLEKNARVQLITSILIPPVFVFLITFMGVAMFVDSKVIVIFSYFATIVIAGYFLNKKIPTVHNYKINPYVLGILLSSAVLLFMLHLTGSI